MRTPDEQKRERESLSMLERRRVRERETCREKGLISLGQLFFIGFDIVSEIYIDRVRFKNQLAKILQVI